jgi:hypothetical protein
MPDYRVVTSRPNGSIRIVQLLGDPSKEAYEAKAKEMNGIVVESDDIPQTMHRGDLRLVDNKIVVSPEPKKQRMIRAIRGIRNQKLTQLDVPSLRAMEDGDTKKSAEIKAKKQILRDLPEIVEQRLSKITDNKRKKDATKLKELQEFRVPELED